MKRALMVAAVFAGGVFSTDARGQQSGKSDAGTAKLLQADYAVPDAPALKMLGLEDSKLLRPSSVRALTAALSSTSGAATYLPSAFAVEFAPFMLRRGEVLSLETYQKQPWLYRLRTSVAASRDSSGGNRSRIAAAIRFSLNDASDLRQNESVIHSILALTGWERDSALMVRNRWIAEGIPFTGPTNAPDSARAAKIVATLALEQRRSSSALVESAKRAVEEARWNASVFDVAIGISGSTADSSARGGRFDGVSGWMTKGWALGQGRQLLLGTRGAYERDLKNTAVSELEAAADAVLRVYVGSNQYKALAELQGTGRAATRPRWLANLGGEFKLTDAVWVTATIGYEATGPLGNGRMVSNWKLKFTPPGN
ncbi:MAG: hypothetical protein ABI120_22470 [Gemmatimonadaceae bacterium]